MKILDADSVSLVKRMVLCETSEMPAIKSVVMAGSVNLATRRMRFIEELQKRGMQSLDPDTCELLDLTIDAWGVSDAARTNLVNHTAATLEEWPAVRLTGFWQSEHEPKNWAERWQAAGDSVCWLGAVTKPGRGPHWSMTALVTSPIWAALGNGVGGFDDTYGWPYPPFAVGSSLGWVDVDRSKCRRLGLI